MIIHTIVFAALSTQQDFAVPAEASPEFRKLAISIEDALVEKNFEKGAKLVAQLPKVNATFRIDTTKVPANQRPAMVSAINASAKMWQTALDGNISFVTSGASEGNINFAFSSTATPTWQWIPSASPSRLNGLLPLATEGTAYNSRLTFAKYLGLATLSKGPSLTEKEVSAAKKILSLSTLLRDSVQTFAPDFVVPKGASSEFHHLVIDITKALSAGDFATAEKLGARLPQAKPTWSFDGSKLNSDQKEEFSRVADSALDAWQKYLTGQVDFKKISTGKADVSITFEPVLAKIAGTNEVAGAAFFFSPDSTKPQLETVIGLKRGPKLQGLLVKDVYNECLFTFGRYLGLAPHPQLGTAMGRIEGLMNNQNLVSQVDVKVIRSIMALSNQLRTAISKRQPIESRQPTLSLESPNIVFDSQFQGDEGRAKILVTNTGTSTLELEVKGDCGCITGDIQPTLLPGKSAILTGIFNTVELAGDVHHNLILKTNDPDRPLVVIPCSIMVNPRAEVVYVGSNTAYMDDAEKSFTFYVNSAEAKVFKITEAAVMGMQLTAKYEPFEGEVMNFQKLGKKQMIRGYKVTVDTTNVPTAALFGRSSAMVYLRTDNPKVALVKAQMFIQKGIVTLPESVYFGSPQGVADSTFVLTRLGRPFNIKKISSDLKYLSFDIVPTAEAKPSGYSIRVIYDGKAPGHRLKGMITVETDDPKQSIIKLPVQTSQT